MRTKPYFFDAFPSSRRTDYPRQRGEQRTGVVIVGGALGMNPWSFFGALAVVRLFRFGVEGALAHRYGTQIVRWMNTPTFQTVVGVFIGLALIGTIVSAVVLVRGSRRKRASE